MFGLFKKKPKESPVNTNQIVPRIKNEHYRSFLIENGLPESHLELMEPIVGDLYLTYAVDRGNMFEMLTPRHLEEFKISSKNLKPLAEENFRKNVPSVNLQKYGSFYNVQTGQNAEACLIIDDNFWTTEAKKLKGSLVASVPHRDHLMFCDSDDVDAINGLKEFTAQIYNETQDNHSLSLNLFLWTANGWEVFSA